MAGNTRIVTITSDHVYYDRSADSFFGDPTVSASATVKFVIETMLTQTLLDFIVEPIESDANYHVQNQDSVGSENFAFDATKWTIQFKFKQAVPKPYSGNIFTDDS